METIHSVPEPIATAEHSVKKKKADTDPKQQEELTKEERLAEMERMLAFAHLMPTIVLSIVLWGAGHNRRLVGLFFLFLQWTNCSYGFPAS